MKNKEANNTFEDGTDHRKCEKCGYCIDCGDCEEYGCGIELPVTICPLDKEDLEEKK